MVVVEVVTGECTVVSPVVVVVLLVGAGAFVSTVVLQADSDIRVAAARHGMTSAKLFQD